MTCIVGLVVRGEVFIGGDSAGSSNQHVTIRETPKVFTRDGFIFGYTTSFRMGDLLQLRVPAPKPLLEGADLREHLITTWIDDEWRRVIKKLGYMYTKDGVDRGGCFLVGYKGQLCVVEPDFQVGTPHSGYDAVGSGASVALGAMYVLATNTRFSGRSIVSKALAAAAELTPYVRPPFIILSS